MCKSQPSTHGQLTGVYDVLTLRRPFPLKPGPWSPNIKILAGTAPLDPLRRPYSPTSRPSSALNCRQFFFSETSLNFFRLIIVVRPTSMDFFLAIFSGDYVFSFEGPQITA